MRNPLYDDMRTGCGGASIVLRTRARVFEYNIQRGDEKDEKRDARKDVWISYDIHQHPS
jgi:hypothetical protein